MNFEPIAKSAAEVATGIIKSVNPIAGIIFGWASAVAFEIIDDVIKKESPIAAAQHAGDRVADLIEELELAGKE